LAQTVVLHEGKKKEPKRPALKNIVDRPIMEGKNRRGEKGTGVSRRRKNERCLKRTNAELSRNGQHVISS